ncbi:unnamed protein product, partial [Didymodactylos carnosus]
MASSTIPTHYPQLIDPTRTPLAFQRLAVPRLRRELESTTLLTRQRALRSLCDYLHDPEHITPCIEQGIPGTLVSILKDNDSFCRLKAAECYYVIASHAIGRRAMEMGDVISRLSELFDDKEASVRRNVHRAIAMYAEAPPGAENIIELKLIPNLLTKLTAELDEIKEIILNTLHYCLMIDKEQALEANCMSVLTNLLTHPTTKIKTLAALDIFHLSLALKGKEQAVDLGTIDHLVEFLDSESDELRSKAAVALASIAIITPAKYCAIKAGALSKLLDMLDSETTELIVNALKAIVCLAEAPEGRKQLLDHIDK